MSTPTCPPSRAVLAAIDEAGVEEIWCLGDVVGYGAEPDACTALIRERCDVCLVGNHDLAVLGALDISAFSETGGGRGRVDPGERQRGDARVPARPRAGGRARRASASSTPPRATRSGSTCSRSTRPKRASTRRRERIGLIGHSHISLFFTRPGRGPRPATPRAPRPATGRCSTSRAASWLLNPGSVGQPRDGDPRAAWLELDTDELDGALPPRPLRHRRRGRDDPRRRPAEPAGGAPRGRPLMPANAGKIRLPESLSRLESWVA